MVSECVQERARYCKYSVLFGLSEGNPSYLCFVRVSDICRLFPGGGRPCWGAVPAARADRGTLAAPAAAVGARAVCLPPAPSARPGPSAALLNARLLIALEIVTFKLLVGDFGGFCGQQETLA